MEAYLMTLLIDVPQVLSLKCIMEFFEISAYNLDESHRKFKEVQLKKRSGGRHTECYLMPLCRNWRTRNFIIYSEGINYTLDYTKTKERETLIFDQSFSFAYGKIQTGNYKRIELKYCNRNLILEAPNFFVFYDTLYAIKDAYSQSPYSSTLRFSSFAPIRNNGDCKWYVDGKDYFSDVCDALFGAQVEVFITGWWVSPELYLKRPVSEDINFNCRLDSILQTLAMRGVIIRIIVYNEPTLALTMNSAYTQSALMKLHPNITVFRHPAGITPSFWSHHEKMVVVDQNIAFIGGLDLCYGRWDSNEHLITDFKSNECFFFPGIDYSNLRIKDFELVKEIEKSFVREKSMPRMPWHDIAIRIKGDPVIDLSRHFVQYWNFVKVDAKENKDEGIILRAKLSRQESDYSRESAHLARKNEFLGKLKEDSIRAPLISKKTMSMIEENPFSEIQISERNSNPIDVKEINLEDPRTSNSGSKPQKGSQSLDSMNKNPYEDSNDFLNFMALRAKAKMEEEAAEEKEKKILESQKILERSNKGMVESMFLELKEKTRKQKERFLENFSRDQEDMLKLKPHEVPFNFNGKFSCQIVRSASNWSLGLSTSKYEESIHFAYYGLISAAKHYVYIENQFFMSSLAGNDVKNLVADAIVKRIRKAAAESEKFHVFIVLPLLPVLFINKGFAGNVSSNDGLAVRYTLDWIYKTLVRSPNSIFSQLSKDPNVENVSDYISVFGLRTHALVNGVPTTEIVYVHSKLMIVDDEVVLIGSANINDRSLLGKRDSEIAVELF